MKEIMTIIGALGIGGIVSSYFTMLWNRRQNIASYHQETKEKRYKCTILLMVASLDFENYKDFLHSHGYTYLSSPDDLIRLLNDKYINSFLYASDDFVLSFKNFLIEDSRDNLVQSALYMRRDLYGVKSKLTLE